MRPNEPGASPQPDLIAPQVPFSALSWRGFLRGAAIAGGGLAAASLAATPGWT